MKPIFCAVLVAASLFTSSSALADLGAADAGVRTDSVSSKVYDAWCGKSRADCKVKFKEGRLSVNNSAGILKEQLKAVTLTHDCPVGNTPFGKQAHFCNFPSDPTYIHNSRKEFRITYIDDEGKEKLGLITFQHYETSKKFARDIGFWSGEHLRPIGPSVKLEL